MTTQYATSVVTGNEENSKFRAKLILDVEPSDGPMLHYLFILFYLCKVHVTYIPHTVRLSGMTLKVYSTFVTSALQTPTSHKMITYVSDQVRPNSSDSLHTAIETKDQENIRKATILLLYIPQNGITTQSFNFPRDLPRITSGHLGEEVTKISEQLLIKTAPTLRGTMHTRE
jgi:hypothetical protein